MSNTGVFTIVSKNYLPFARTLMQSVERCNPDFHRFVILVDTIDGYFNPEDEPFTIVLSGDLSIPNSPWVHFKYTILELNTAVKPFAIEYLAKKYDIDCLLYFDPDIKVYQPLDALVRHLDSNDILLTPHLLAPIDDKCHPDDFDILRSGSYNLGFCGLRMTESTSRMVTWWQDKLYDHCYVDITRGLFTDQRWMDLVPGMFPNVGIIREPGYNVAYWNIQQRRIERAPGGYSVNQQPLFFYHFSGFDPAHPSNFSKHQDRYCLWDLNDAARELILEYSQDVLAHGYREAASLPYAFASFENGVKIPNILRRFVADAPEIAQRIQNPFSDEGYREFMDYWGAFVTDPNGKLTTLTRASLLIYNRRADLQKLAPDLFGPGLQIYLNWLATNVHDAAEFDDCLHSLIRSQPDRVQLAPEDPVAPPPSHPETPSEPAPEVVARPRQMLPGSVALLLQNGGVSVLDGQRNGASNAEDVLEWINHRDREDSPLTRLAVLIYDCRPDLQRQFPDIHRADLHEFCRWLVSYGVVEYGLPDSMVSSIWDTLDRAERTHGLLGGAYQQAVTRLYIHGANSGFMVHTARSVRKRFLRLRRSFENTNGVVRTLDKSVGERGSTAFPAPTFPASHSIDAPRIAVRKLPTDAPLGINIIGYLNSETGVGEGGRRLADAARSVDLPVSLNSYSVGCLSRKQDHRVGVDNQYLYPVNVFVVNADQTNVLFENIEEDKYAARYNIGYWNWELEEFPDRWQDAFQRYDEIWVPSRFILDGVAHKSPVPVVRIPYGVELPTPTVSLRDNLGVPCNQFLFLSFCDLLSVIKRKNPKGVIEAFRKAAAQMPDSHLILKLNNGHLFPDIVAGLRRECADCAITIVDETWGRDSVNAIIADCDCLISLHRAEGFGFTLAEAMYLGKPVITTAYSATLDFTNIHNSMLVDYQLVPIGSDGAPYPANGRWAEPDLGSAADAMVRIYQDPSLRDRIARSGQNYIRENFSYKASGTMMLQRLQRILGKKRCSKRRRWIDQAGLIFGTEIH